MKIAGSLSVRAFSVTSRRIEILPMLGPSGAFQACLCSNSVLILIHLAWASDHTSAPPLPGPRNPVQRPPRLAAGLATPQLVAANRRPTMRARCLSAPVRPQVVAAGPATRAADHHRQGACWSTCGAARHVERAYLDAPALVPEDRSPSPEHRLLILESLYRIEAMLRAMPARVRGCLPALAARRADLRADRRGDQHVAGDGEAPHEDRVRRLHGGAAVSARASSAPAARRRLCSRRPLDLLVLRQLDPQATASAIAQWRQRSAAHARSAERAEGVLRSFDRVPGEIGRKTLLVPGRRAPAAAESAGAWHGAAGVARGAGGMARARRAGRMAGGRPHGHGRAAPLVLKTARAWTLDTETAVDLVFDAGRRCVRLVRGEIMVVTGKDAAGRRLPCGVRRRARSARSARASRCAQGRGATPCGRVRGRGRDRHRRRPAPTAGEGRAGAFGGGLCRAGEALDRATACGRGACCWPATCA